MSKHIRLDTLLEIRNQCNSIIGNHAEFVTNYNIKIKANNKWYYDWDVYGKFDYIINDLQLVINNGQIIVNANGKIQINHITLTVDEMQALIMLSICVRLTNIK